jgi:hypothetical protein
MTLCMSVTLNISNTNDLRKQSDYTLTMAISRSTHCAERFLFSSPSQLVESGEIFPTLLLVSTNGTLSTWNIYIFINDKNNKVWNKSIHNKKFFCQFHENSILPIRLKFYIALDIAFYHTHMTLFWLSKNVIAWMCIYFDVTS